MGHGHENDGASLLDNSEDMENPDHKMTKQMSNLPAEVELQEVHTLQAELVGMQTSMWAADDMTEEEHEELERKANLLKVKLVQASNAVKEWGMTTGLEQLSNFEQSHKKWHDDGKPVNENLILLSLLPVALIFMGLVLGASTIHFSDAKPIPGELYAVSDMVPIIWPLGTASYMVEVRIQIPSTAGPGESGHGGGHRRSVGSHSKPTSPLGNGLLRKMGNRVARALGDYKSRNAGEDMGLVMRQDHGAPAPAPPAHAPAHGPSHDQHAETGHEMGTTGAHDTDGHDTAEDHGAGAHDEHAPNYITAYLFDMKDDEWKHADPQTFEVMNKSAHDIVVLRRMRVGEEEYNRLLEIQLDQEPLGSVLVITTDSDTPLPLAIQLHSLGWLGPYQVVIAGFIMVVLFGLIMTEVLHRTMAAMIGAAMTLVVLALQNRVPNLSTVVGWMDHGTLGLLWGMMLIVGITMRTGVFEWTGVMACKMSGGDKTKLLLLLCVVTAFLSAFLDNVTTILLIAPVTCKLCKLVNIDPVPFLISEAIFSNVGGTATMIGDPPNIIIGNLLAKYLDFNAFLFNLAPGVILASPATFFFLTWWFKGGVKGQLVVDIAALQKMYPITNRGLLIKCGVVLACVIMSFFLHPVTHLDPAWIAIMGAVWLLVAFDMHHCHEALLGVEWDTLLFFAALFVVVEGVGELGLLRFIANTLSGMVGTAPVESRQLAAICLIVWASAIFSAFVDNIPFTATMVPVMLQLVEQVEGISIEPLAWALAFGACFGGNGTLIGASANIVMASKAEVEGHHISFIDFFKVGFPVMLITVAIANIYLMILNAAFWQATAGQ